MCGIAGTFGRTAPSPDRVAAALATMARRGPDAEGAVNLPVGDHMAALLHTRLSIIDLDPRSNQPLERDGLVIAYNGEIYNYLELKSELEALGEAFHTTSDTEVLLAAWRRWGPACLDKLEGMWAFAIVDRRDGTLTLCRDRFGEKPFYLWPLDGTLYFASEVKTLEALAGRRPGVNRTQVLRYLTQGFRSLHKHGDSFFDGVFELPPSTYLTLRGPELTQPEFYWHLRHIPRPMSQQDAQEGARERLFESVRLRMRADVPLAFCLSGGIDSSTLAAIAAKSLGQDIECFSIIDTDERYDESSNIAMMVEALGCRHHAIHTSTEGFFERMEKLVAYHDSPVATISYYIHSFLSEAIHAAGFKVAISGTAADELFTGYYDHYSMWLARMWKRSQIDSTVDFDKLMADWQDSFGRYVQNPELQDPLVFMKQPDHRAHLNLDQDLFESFLTVDFHEEFSETEFTDDLLRNRMMNELFAEIVPVILHEDDANSMACSIENRSPFLDRHLAEFLYSVPSEYLIGDGLTKLLLRQTGAGLVPDGVRLDKRKRGFNASINSLVDRSDPETRAYLLADGPIFDFVDRDRVARFLDEDMASNSFSKFLFTFISTRIFLDQHHARN